MEQSELIKELTEVGKELERLTWGRGVRDNILRFARLSKYYDDGGGEVSGLLNIYEKGTLIEKVDELIGCNIHWMFDFYEDGDKLDDNEDICRLEKAKLQIKYCQMIEGFDLDKWTPEIIKRFEAGLDFLKLELKKGKVTSDQGVTK